MSLVTSKRPFLPPAGPISGLLLDMQRDKQDRPKALMVETVWGTFRAQLPKGLRTGLNQELELGQAIRLWLSHKGHKIVADLVVPHQAKALVYSGPREACIWVCTSKSCCKRGSDEVWQALQEAARKSTHKLEIKKCDCLGTCKKGPSLKVKGHKRVYQVDPQATHQWLNGLLQTRN
jgi:NADH:ubiquinone oxidoreductase subunit E